MAISISDWKFNDCNYGKMHIIYFNLLNLDNLIRPKIQGPSIWIYSFLFLTYNSFTLTIIL